ncbi:MAG: hypothetical protein WBF33_28550 [Candidatus Nitrosopolaris sp.]
MLIKHLSSDEVKFRQFIMCGGPPAMLSILDDKLKIAKERIKLEEFNRLLTPYPQTTSSSTCLSSNGTGSSLQHLASDRQSGL